MAYKFKLDETLATGVRRIALQQLDHACETLETLDATLWVHETRKSLKRVRALLRLARGGVERGAWRQLNGELRDVGRLLSAHRDRDVRRETIARLAETADRPLASALARLAELDAGPALSGKEHQALSGKPHPSAPEPSRTAFVAVTDRLAAVRSDLSGLDLELEPRTLEGGLARTHRAGRQALEICKKAPADEAFHELRKAVQLHWRQMQVLGPAWPDLFKARVDSARVLAQGLGLEHDFAVLAQWMHETTPQGAQRKDIRLVVDACRQAQGVLRTTALGEADLLFAGRPRVFASEAMSYWSAAVAAGTADRHAVTTPAKRAPVRAARTKPMAKKRHRAAGDQGSRAVAADGSGGRGRVRSKRSKARPAPAGST